jgi:ubiquinone/menaquinone biosynthesis C-methylase UbiE
MKGKIRVFDENASRYDQWFQENRHVYQSELLTLSQMLPAGADSLEIGVGSGRFADPLSVEFGIEPSEEMAGLARRRGIKVVSGVAEALPFRDSVFDCVLMVTTICFVDDIQIAFREAMRVLRSGGHFVVGFVDQDSPVGILYQRNRDKSVFYRLATFYSVKEVISCLRKTGFGEPEFAQVIFRPLSGIRSIEQPKPGYGEGSFVVVRSDKA